MLTRKARLWVILIAVILLFWTIYQGVYEISAAVVLMIGFLIWGYFREGTVVMAAREFHAKNYEEAEILLREIEDPDRLGRHRRGFYEFIYGNLELHKHNYEEAEKHFQIASRFPLRNQNDKAIVLVHLANINLRKKDKEKAKAYVEKAKTFKISARVKNIIEKIESEI
ncbi:tetratricopeptide repeat protein [Daejeonella sp.]|uniref:tetratricopeptide repeat protein n=1 Tax=Daejeonella sp. TaxID=2805397 RepID=UPI0025B9EA6B|nr:tetratricopeptide repeat protein [Daejeonella sp.]